MAAFDYLIVGNGVAGTTAAETLRRLSPDAAIVIISKEAHPLYSRVLLPHLVAGKTSRERTFLRKREQYEVKGIEVRYGVAVARIRPKDHALDLDDGTELGYRKLLLAVGAEPLALTVPGSDLAGVRCLRTLEDAERISEDLSRIASGPETERKAAVIGGGLISLEFPPLFAARGLGSLLIIRGPRYWWRVLDQEGSLLVEQTLGSSGTEILRDTEVAACVGTGTIKEAVMKDGRKLKTSFLAYGVGLTGAPEIVTRAGIAGGPQGILTDEYLMTDAPDVWAVGDCACFTDQSSGRRHRLANWLTAQEQARAAAEEMAGAKHAPFQGFSQYSTQVFGLPISFLGDLTERTGSVWVRRGSAAEGLVIRMHLREGRMVGAALVGASEDRAAIVHLIKSRILLEGQERLLADPGSRIKTIL